MSANSIFIAKRKGERVHVFLRAYRRASLESPDYSFPPDDLDRLLQAQNPETFAYAVSSFLPLSTKPLHKIEVSRWPRTMTVRQFRGLCKDLYEPIDEAVLIEEYTGLKDDAGELNKSSLKRAVSELDAMRDGSLERFLAAGAFDGHDVIVAEPVLDWTAARAFAANIVLFQALLGDIPATQESGPATPGSRWVFGSHSDAGLRERVRQFTYNPVWRTHESIGKSTIDGLRGGSYTDGAPWLAGYLDRKASLLGGAADGIGLKGSELIRFKGAASISRETLPFSTRARKQVIDRSLYLVAKADANPLELARDFIEAILATTRDRTSLDGEPLGWSLDYGSAVEQPPAPTPVFYSQGARLLYEAAFHGSELQAAACRNCGRPMLNRSGSKPRRFCSASCKTTYSNARKEVTDD